MTTRRPDDDARDGDALRDPRFDAAWRRLSREEPPPTLDAAIRAAARREVGSAPRLVGAPGHVPSALRPQRWWWPLAAAATIGAIVIGLLQLAPEDHVVPGADKAVVSDIPAAPPQQASREAATSPETAPMARQAPPADEKAAPPASSAPAPAARPEATPAPRKDARSLPPTEERAAAPQFAPAPPAPTEKKLSKQDARTVAPAPLGEPFPAEAAQRAAAPPAPTTTAAPAAKTESATAVGALSRERAVPRAAPPDAEEQTALERRTQARDAAIAAQPSAKARVAQNLDSAGGGGPSEARAKEHPPLAVPDWIALIRRLRDEGRTDQAAKELAAFRAEHPDHERLLPPDLRDWRPPAR